MIIVDNCSVEDGTEEYLKEKEEQGFKIVRSTHRDPSNEFAKALNAIYEESTGKYVILLQGDMQFILAGGWLKEYVALNESFGPQIGCITLDAQRRVTHQANELTQPVCLDKFSFVADLSRPPLAGAADAFFARSVLEEIYPWATQNDGHEGTGDSETKMLQKVAAVCYRKNYKWKTVMPVFPPAAAIYTDARGTNARIRGNRRYGDYWAPKEDFRYYEILSGENIVSAGKAMGDTPRSIEEVVIPVGFDAPIDETGSWKKNPIRPELALPGEYVDLDYFDYSNTPATVVSEDEDFLKEWLTS